MRRWRKAAKWALVSSILAGVAALIGINLYLLSDHARSRVRQALSRRLGSPAEFGAMSYAPWEGLTISEFTVPRPKGRPFLEAKKLVVKVPLAGLFGRPIRIKNVIAHDAVIVALRSPAPSRPSPKPPTPPGPELVAVAPVPNVVTDPNAGATPSKIARPIPPAPPQPVPASSPRFAVDGVQLRNGTFRLLSPDAVEPLAEARGLEGQFRRSDQAGWSGRGSCGALEIHGKSVLKEARGVASWRNGLLEVTEALCRVEGGVVEGQGSLHFSQSGLPFQGRARFRDIDLVPWASQFTDQARLRSGKAHGEIAALGWAQARNTWRLQGQVEVRDGSLAKDGVIESLGQKLDWRHIQDLPIEVARAVFAFDGAALQVRDFHLKSFHSEARGRGSVSPTQGWNLAVRLYFSERLRGLIEEVERRLGAPPGACERLEGRDDYYRDFLVSGDLRQPSAAFFGPPLTLLQTIEIVRDLGESRGRDGP